MTLERASWKSAAHKWLLRAHKQGCTASSLCHGEFSNRAILRLPQDLWQPIRNLARLINSRQERNHSSGSHSKTSSVCKLSVKLALFERFALLVMRFCNDSNFIDRKKEISLIDSWLKLPHFSLPYILRVIYNKLRHIKAIISHTVLMTSFAFANWPKATFDWRTGSGMSGGGFFSSAFCLAASSSSSFLLLSSSSSAFFLSRSSRLRANRSFSYQQRQKKAWKRIGLGLTILANIAECDYWMAA